jgi:hypothetical protein
MILKLSFGSLPGPYSPLGFASTFYWQLWYIAVLQLKQYSVSTKNKLFNVSSEEIPVVSLKTICVTFVFMEHILRTTRIMKVNKEFNPCTVLPK